MIRRKFIATAVVGSACAFADTLRTGNAPATPPMKCTITVIHRMPGSKSGQPCPLFRDNQVLTAESPWGKPEGFCDEGWADVVPYLRLIDEGKTDAAICGCTGPSTVYFRIERIS